MPMPEARGDPPAGQACLDAYSTAGEWKNLDEWKRTNGEAWTVPSAGAGCPVWRQFTSAQAQAALRGQHLMVVGDLHARLFYSALVYLVNGTATPNDVAPGYMRHKWEVGSPCAWNAGKQAKGWYDWAGWGEFAKNHRCHIEAYGWPNLHNVTLKNSETSKNWWGKGTARDVMTMLLRDSPRYSSYTRGDVTISYVWRSVIRTGASYKRQHPKVMEKVASLIGRGDPTMIISGMYAFDSQWQPVEEVSGRQRGLYEGVNEKWPTARKLALGPSSCQPDRPYSHYMSKKSRNNMFHGMENASSLRPGARAAAHNQSWLFLDTLPSKAAFTPTVATPCHYDLPLGPMAEALVQIALNAGLGLGK